MSSFDIAEYYIPKIYRTGEPYHNLFNKIVSSISRKKLAEIVKALQNDYYNGDSSEVATADILRSKGYTVLRNLYLPYRDRLFTEIDLLCYNESQILVLENKSYKNAKDIVQHRTCWEIYNSYGTDTYPHPKYQQFRHAEALRDIVGDVAIRDFKYFISVWYAQQIKYFKVDLDEYFTGKENEEYKVFPSREEMLNFLSAFSSSSDIMKAIHIYMLQQDKEIQRAV